MSDSAPTEALLAANGPHYLPYAKPTKKMDARKTTTTSNKSVMDEKHTDTASVRSTSTLSSLKSLLPKKRSSVSSVESTKPKSPSKLSETAIRHEARAAYFQYK
ncbi:uncharacterized protein AB675_4867 [Cyphellophora attinorum]|uniref:Uncharacterized protein n=1 Tax=Cyphellophora attinorum TaxID=1664694 RepID=A0A0N0NHL7_9EURO|nr:uncharacterized protein AB675_4867 [Phialophora attinorum]KPI34831.1 hypothetical protein AB675_4867 [Phialophora attinorum]